MTLEDIKGMDKELLTVDEVAPILGISARLIRRTAKEAPEELGFPVIVMRKQIRILRRPLINFIEGTEQNG